MTSTIHRSLFATAFLALCVALSGCQTKAQSGAGVGALGGALVGSLASGKHRGRNAAIGAVVGGLIGNGMDVSDRTQVNNAFETYPSGQTADWVNPDTGNQYAVTPQAAYSGSGGRTCRNAEIDGYIDGRRETIQTTACRRSDGVWEM